MQLHGGYGFIKDYPAEKFYRDVKLCTIGEGTQRDSAAGDCAGSVEEVGDMVGHYLSFGGEKVEGLCRIVEGIYRIVEGLYGEVEGLYWTS